MKDEHHEINVMKKLLKVIGNGFKLQRVELRLDLADLINKTY
jgi:hypothetical protein